MKPFNLEAKAVSETSIVISWRLPQGSVDAQIWARPRGGAWMDLSQYHVAGGTYTHTVTAGSYYTYRIIDNTTGEYADVDAQSPVKIVGSGGPNYKAAAFGGDLSCVVPETSSSNRFYRSAPGLYGSDLSGLGYAGQWFQDSSMGNQNALFVDHNGRHYFVMSTNKAKRQVSAGGAATSHGFLQTDSHDCRVEFTGTLSSGVWTLAYDAAQTADIAYNASAADVQAALAGLSVLYPGIEACQVFGDTADLADPVYWIGLPDGFDASLITVQFASLVGGTAAVAQGDLVLINTSGAKTSWYPTWGFDSTPIDAAGAQRWALVTTEQTLGSGSTANVRAVYSSTDDAGLVFRMALMPGTATRHGHCIVWDPFFKTWYVTDGDSRKSLWRSDDLRTFTEIGASPMGGYTTLIPTERGLISGTDRSYGNNFLLRWPAKALEPGDAPDVVFEAPNPGKTVFWGGCNWGGGQVWVNTYHNADAASGLKSALFVSLDGGDTWRKAAEGALYDGSNNQPQMDHIASYPSRQALGDKTLLNCYKTGSDGYLWQLRKFDA